MRDVSDRFKSALVRSHKRATEITCTIPGGSPVAIGQAARRSDGRYGPGWTAASVASAIGSGIRYSASLSVTPEPGTDTYAMVSTPGAIFKIRHGIDFGAGDVELVDCGVYEAATGGVRITGGDISLTLVDLWQRVERCRFLVPHSPASGKRSSLISAAVSAVIPGAEVLTSADGGTFTGGSNVWDYDRTQFVSDLASDGSLDAAFDASGAFRIRAEPVMATAPVWTYRTGIEGNIVEADRDRPLDRLYNMVIVVPIDGEQTWTRQSVSIDDASHPRHRSKIGDVPFFYRSPTLLTASAALAAARTILQRVIGSTETLTIEGLSNPALEVGDVVAVLHERTDTDPGFQAIHFIDSLQFDLSTGSGSIATRSTAQAEILEAA